MEYENQLKLKKPLVSIVIPGYNEEAIIVGNLTIICDYLKTLEDRYDWEIIFINDGSKDKTGILADDFTSKHNRVKVFHHFTNLNLGNALKTGFAQVNGKYTITLDLDLSYAPYHIGQLLDTLENQKADIVLASPYMKGGKITAVPFIRRVLSRSVNRFMRLSAQEKYHTYTCLVRGYNTEFLKGLNLKTKDYEICPEIIYKSMILRARIIEIPAHLDWTEQNKLGTKRTSGMKVLQTFISGLMAAFIFRPYIYFLAIGLMLLLIALYLIGHLFYFTFQIYPTISIGPEILVDRFSLAVAKVLQQRPHAFYLAGITLIAAIQVLSLGFISLQSKRYFEETFNLCSNLLKRTKGWKSDNPENLEK